MFSLFKFDKINCQFSTSDVPPCQTSRKGNGSYYSEYNDFSPALLTPYRTQFSEGYTLYEICITIKENLLNPSKIGSKTHFNIYQLIYKKIINFLKKHKLKDTQILLITEYSKSNRLHFHGCVNRYFSPEMAGLLDSVLCKYVGRTKTNKIQSDKYFEYMTKDTHNCYYSIPNTMICKL